MDNNNPYPTFEHFYPFYLSQHSNKTCQRLHFVGTCLVISVLLTAIFTWNFWLLFLAPVLGYGFAWVGHFGYEKNKPATFKYPLYSFMGDFVMFWEILTGKIPF